MQTKKYADQVIVIDDGSTDNTAEIARAAGAVVIRHRQETRLMQNLETSQNTKEKR